MIHLVTFLFYTHPAHQFCYCTKFIVRVMRCVSQFLTKKRKKKNIERSGPHKLNAKWDPHLQGKKQTFRFVNLQWQFLLLYLSTKKIYIYTSCFWPPYTYNRYTHIYIALTLFNIFSLLLL